MYQYPPPDDGSLARLNLEITVAPDGSVSAARLDKGEETPLGRCILSAAKGSRFEKSRRGISFTYPMRF